MKTLTIKNARALSNYYISKIQPSDQREFVRVHTKQVVEIAKILGKYKKLDLKLLEIAGWVHDIGYVAAPEHHAIYSIGLLKKKYKLNDKLVDCILNHGNKGKPKTKEGKIFQIADKVSFLRPEIVKLILDTNKGKIKKGDLAFLKRMTDKAIKLLQTY